MPIYEYECLEHGVFEEQRKVAESGAAGACPHCLQASPRIVSAPSLGRLERSQVRAIERNEKSRHEPRIVRTEPPRSRPEVRPMRSAMGGYPWAIGH
jgi:putative FmdB family regulatory protein